MHRAGRRQGFVRQTHAAVSAVTRFFFFGAEEGAPRPRVAPPLRVRRSRRVCMCVCVSGVTRRQHYKLENSTTASSPTPRPDQRR